MTLHSYMLIQSLSKEKKQLRVDEDVEKSEPLCIPGMIIKQ